MITPVFIPRRGRSTAWGWLWATALTAGLQACADGPSPPKTDFASGTRNPIQISRTQIAHSVPFPQSGSEPDAGQMSALFAFIAANGVGPKDTVLIEHGGELRDEAHAETLASRLSSIGLRPGIVNNTTVAAGVERVVVERYVAIAPNCPDWSQKPSPNYQNDNQRNFGCADAANLAAMVADPKDLAMGASLGAQLGDPVTKPVADYRTGTPAGDGLGASGKAPAGGAGASSGGGAGSGAPSATGP